MLTYAENKDTGSLWSFGVALTARRRRRGKRNA
jgi:hypothetical protein